MSPRLVRSVASWSATSASLVRVSSDSGSGTCPGSGPVDPLIRPQPGEVSPSGRRARSPCRGPQPHRAQPGSPRFCEGDTMRSSKSDKLAKVAAQAKEQAAELSERVGPALSDARDRLGPALEDARERITPVLEDARDRAVPAAERARDAARVRLADAAANVATRLDDRLPDDRTPDFIADASTNKKGGKLRKLLVLAGLGGVAALVVKRLQGDPAPTWQAATPPPAPAPRPAAGAPTAQTPVTPAAPASGAEGDAAGGTPGEVASDQVDEPHEPTTPDAPAEQVDVSKN
ncbi:hypothetical protein GCM10009815_29510 [Nocardioides marmoribigeumensis]